MNNTNADGVHSIISMYQSFIEVGLTPEQAEAATVKMLTKLFNKKG